MHYRACKYPQNLYMGLKICWIFFIKYLYFYFCHPLKIIINEWGFFVY